MGFLGFLKFLLLCSDFLAWPVFALGYPLCASIRAIENGSKCHMKKLVIYWTLFSLMSLFEIAFVKIIEWIPYWSGIKLIVICLLVVPQFDGACYVYDCLVHPCLSLDIQALMSMLYKKENRLVKTEIFLDVAEKYIKENGPEAFEKLIAAKLECMKSDSSTGRQVGEKKAEATLKQPEIEQDTIQKDKVMLQPTVQHATKTNVTKLENHTQPNLATWVEKKSDALADVKEMTPQDSNAADNNFPETLPKKVQCEWTCALCLVTTTSETTLNAHLQGKKHKSKCKSEQLDTTEEDKVMLQPTEQSTARKPNLTKLGNHAQLGTWVEKKPDAPADIKEMSPPDSEAAESERPETPPLNKVQREWTCALCLVTTTSEHNLNAHLQGNKHKSQCEQLKTSKNKTKDTGSSPLMKVQVNKSTSEVVKKPAKSQWANNHQKSAMPKHDGAAGQAFIRICRVCDVKSPSYVDWQSHIKGKRHLSNIENRSTGTLE